jgi:hypothetical protein
MLLSGDPGGENFIPVLGCAILDNNRRPLHSLVSVPGDADSEGSQFCLMAYAGCEWTFILVDAPTAMHRERVVRFGLKQCGEILLTTRHYRLSRVWRMIVHEIGGA